MLKRKLPEIRSMTTMDPVDFCPKLRDMFANCEIALVFLSHIGGSFLHGVTFYDKNKIVVGLTVCGKDADKFWFIYSILYNPCIFKAYRLLNVQT